MTATAAATAISVGNGGGVGGPCVYGRSSAASDVTPTSPLRARCHWSVVPPSARPSPHRHRRRSLPYMGQRRASFIKPTLIRRPAPRCGQCALSQCVRPPRIPTHASRAPSVQQVDRRQHHVRVRDRVRVRLRFCLCVCASAAAPVMCVAAVLSQ